MHTLFRVSVRRHRRTTIAFLAGVASLALVAVAALSLRSPAFASSHREAPLISKDAFADNTDTYVFVSPENQNNVVMVASWIPFEGPEGGPNYFEWDDRALYDIYVDNDGDARADITYTLSSHTQVVNPNTFLYNVGAINSLTDADWNRPQFYTVTETTEGGGAQVLVSNKRAAPVNIGEKSTPDYTTLESEAVYTAPGGFKVFAGPTDDPFFVDLQVFDLLTLRGQKPPIGYGQYNLPTDSLSAFNVHSLVVEGPIAHLKNGSEPVLGIWAGTRRPTLSVLDVDDVSSASYAQVSRLGMPLVNEVVIPMGLKDAFNSLRPEQDLTVYNLLQKSVENPEIGTLLCGLYGVTLPGDGNDDCNTEFSGTPRSGRGDIFDIFLTGMKLAAPFTINTKGGAVTLPTGFNVNQPAGVTPAEMIRINTDIKGDTCSPTPNRLGILGGDACGFPNGRRLTDDVVEIELLAVAGAAYPVLDGRDASFSFDPGLIGVLTDGVDKNDKDFRTTFPYLAPAQSGQSHWHMNPYFNVLMPWIFKNAQLPD